MTYFGEAFYRDALPDAKTLQEAFERAKAAIAVREQKEHETPSEPQAFFGREISELLNRNPMRRNGELRAQSMRPRKSLSQGYALGSAADEAKFDE
jgi:hypothetical protein